MVEHRGVFDSGGVAPPRPPLRAPRGRWAHISETEDEDEVGVPGVGVGGPPVVAAPPQVYGPVRRPWGFESDDEDADDELHVDAPPLPSRRRGRPQIHITVRRRKREKEPAPEPDDRCKRARAEKKRRREERLRIKNLPRPDWMDRFSEIGCPLQRALAHVIGSQQHAPTTDTVRRLVDLCLGPRPRPRVDLGSESKTLRVSRTQVKPLIQQLAAIVFWVGRLFWSSVLSKLCSEIVSGAFLPVAAFIYALFDETPMKAGERKRNRKKNREHKKMRTKGKTADNNPEEEETKIEQTELHIVFCLSETAESVAPWCGFNCLARCNAATVIARRL